MSKYLTQASEIENAINHLSSYPILWLDTEIADWRTRKPRLSLIQISANLQDSSGIDVYILDVLDKSDLIDYFIEQIMMNSDIEKVFHNANYDLRFLGGKSTKNITCTLQIAKKITREKLQVSDLKLKTLAAQLCNFSLVDDKGTSDWGKRPLTNEQLSYATMDVIYLAHVHDYLLNFGKIKMSRLIDSVIQFFQDENWSYQKSPDEDVLILGVQGDEEQWDCFAKTVEEQDYFIFYSVYPKPIPQQNALSVAEFLMQINAVVNFGNFEMNDQLTKIYYKTSIKVTNYVLNQALIKNIVYMNIQVMNSFIKKIEEVSMGRKITEVLQTKIVA